MRRMMARPRFYPTNAARQRAYRKRLKEAARRRKLWDPTGETPQDLFEKYHAVFGFMLDVCALPSNAKCPRYFTPDDDALQQVWTGVCWCNPPYGRGKAIEKWVRKAHESAQAGAIVVCLLPSSTSSYWFHHIVLPYAAAYEFIEGRLKFGGTRYKYKARFDNMAAIFMPGV